MKLYITSIFLFLFSLASNAQITKGNWLVGGDASFTSTKYASEATASYTQTYFQISPKVGYFLFDKFAAGLKPSLSYTTTKATWTQHVTEFGIGPFAHLCLILRNQNQEL